MQVLGLVIILLIIIFVSMTIKVVAQQRVGVVERLGKFHKLMHPGLNILIPLVDRVRDVHDLRVQQTNIPPQSVITRDNVQVKIDTIIFYQVTDAAKASYGISDFVFGVRNITTATMRQIIGRMELDETLAGRERISTEIRTALDEATEKWGVRIDRVELVDIMPPLDIQEAMDKQMKAERTKRAVILEAEAARQDMILRAEGDKASRVLRAEGDREAKIKEAEGFRQAQILNAEGQAQAIQDVASAERNRIEQLRAAMLDENVLAYKSFESLIELSKNPANKVFIPTGAMDTLGALGAMGELFKAKQDATK
jgi:regulator of protease activity HflC (stomatin/prohibitin superfamily)